MYRLEPGPASLAAHTAAATDLDTVLQHIADAGNASDRRVVEQILATNQLYLFTTHEMFIAVDEGDTLRAMKLDHSQIDPVFSTMQKQRGIAS